MKKQEVLDMMDRISAKMDHLCEVLSDMDGITRELHKRADKLEKTLPSSVEGRTGASKGVKTA